MLCLDLLIFDQTLKERSPSDCGPASWYHPVNMVASASSGKKPLPDMMTSIRIDQSGQVEIVDQLLLP